MSKFLVDRTAAIVHEAPSSRLRPFGQCLRSMKTMPQPDVDANNITSFSPYDFISFSCSFSSSRHHFCHSAMNFLLPSLIRISTGIRPLSRSRSVSHLVGYFRKPTVKSLVDIVQQCVTQKGAGHACVLSFPATNGDKSTTSAMIAFVYIPRIEVCCWYRQ
nr:hypothetical protein CFP56_77810 [Quercus suber]